MHSLEEVKDGYKKLGSPAKHFKTVHVTGTNGKGTVSLNIAKGLENQRYKTALFSSPHIHSVTERISINGDEISLARMEKIYKENISILEKFYFFELLTLIAYIYFAEEGVDIAVIEVGVGGLHDSTNVIHPVLSVITNITFDHTQLLGSSLESIAYNKAKIIKKDTPVILGFHARHPLVYEQAKQVNAKVIDLDREYEDYLEENKAISDAALLELGIEPSKEFFSPPARFEVHKNIIFDMAHNRAGFLSLKQKCLKTYPSKKIIAIWNIASDKEILPCLEILHSFTEEVYFYPSTSDRLITKEMAKQLGLKEYDGEQSDLILACGSAYIMDDLKVLLGCL
ncbi:MAG: Folylpolyglutamate synthase [Chlamydiia bacterium]|nr:Folylpolyglutamate synthase [Chlamydiia bacterium]MCH9618098.1 Folylpolyglutamate synthase [Chlamydiia bacterium]MCH9623978.1 Folylpolyglutamate synthase [Chlamydiia bacterium]